jgi:hypothetical protein
VARQRGRYLLADLRDAFERPGSLVAVVLVAVGALALLLGLAGAVLVGPDSSWTAARTVRPGAPAVVLTSGVVGAVGPEVTVTVRRQDGGSLFVGRAISSDVTDLIGGAPRLVVTGVRPLHRLVTTPVPGVTSLGQVQRADIWRDTSVGGGARSLDWHPDDESQSVLVASTDGSALPALRITVTWHRGGWFPAAVLLILVGAGLLTLGLHRLTSGHTLRRFGRWLNRTVGDRLLSGLSHIPMPARRPTPVRTTEDDS